ncbi:MAG: alpha/beta hydrolase, partial [Candidatus Heimdallarchaeota archaeon]
MIQKPISAIRMKIMFFILILPIIIFGELLRLLHRVGPYSLHNSNLDPKRGFIRTSDGKTICVNYTDKSDQVAIVIHGYMSSSRRSYMKYADFLSKNNIDIVAMDFRNHGLSSLSLPISAGYYERFDVIATLKWAKSKWDKVHIIASSMGAYSVVYALADQSESQLPTSIILESFGTDLKVGTRNT